MPPLLSIKEESIKKVIDAVRDLQQNQATGTVDTFGTPIALDYARFTDADTIEGRSYAEVRTDLGLVIGTNVQAYDADLDTYAANPLTAGEIGQLQNIDTTTISATQWGYVGALDQNLRTTDNPQFATIELGAVSDTTLARGAAGILHVEGNEVPSPGSVVAGDILYADGVNSWTRLAKGSDTDVLTLASGLPSWAAPAGGGGDAAFLAYNSATDSNVTGDGTLYTVDFDTEVFDIGADFASDTFTAPTTGYYLLTAQVQLTGLTSASFTGVYLRIRTSNRNYDLRMDQSAGAVGGASDPLTFTTSVVADMDVADTADVRVDISGGTAIVDVIGGGALYTFFSGWHLG